MVDVSAIDTSTSLLGTEIAFPVLVAPTAFHKLADPEGEVATARAAHSVDTIMVNSTLSTVALEDVAATRVKRWFQLYILKDRARTQSMIERAANAGFTAIVLTVDTPMIGIRYADQRNRFQLPAHLTMATLGTELPETEGSGLRAFTEQFDQSLTWRDIEWICEVADLPVLTKGVLRAEDARNAVDAGAAGVIVSNHGGRQLDGDPATLEVLPEIVDEVGDDTALLLDGGVRTGPDVVKALAIGADAVLIGRPVLWGLAAGGEQGAARVLGLLRDEVADTLRQLGAPTLADLTPDLVKRVR
jgi:4-hydroxymandelate oxidase